MAEAEMIQDPPTELPPPRYQLTLTEREAKVLWMALNWAPLCDSIRKHAGKDVAGDIRTVLSRAGLRPGNGNISFGYISPTDITGKL